MPVSFDTCEKLPAQRLAAWSSVVCDVYTDLDCYSNKGSAFFGSVTSADLGGISCSEIASTQQKVFRTRSRIARAKSHHVLVAFANRGRGLVVQDGRELELTPGSFTLYDTSRPYELHFSEDFHQTILKLPQEQLQQRVGDTERLSATVFSSEEPVSRLAFGFATSAAKAAVQLSPEAGAILAGQIIDLLSLACSSRLVSDMRPASSHRSAMLLRLKSFIQENLSDPDLTIADAAKAMGVSTRYVNGLLEAEQTSFRRYTLTRRLEMCRRQLRDAALMHLQISQIAYSWGFKDMAYFSRSFRSRFGLPPREWRRIAQDG